MPASELKGTASCRPPTPSLPEVTALQRRQLSTASTCSQATSSNRLVHYQTCQYQALIQLPILCKQIHSQFISSFSCQHKIQQMFFQRITLRSLPLAFSQPLSAAVLLPQASPTIPAIPQQADPTEKRDKNQCWEGEGFWVCLCLPK